MNILIAPDKFRGSLDAADVIRAVSAGIKEVSKEISITSVELADGGEGTMRILTELAEGRYISVVVQDPLGRPIPGQYGFSEKTQTAFIEMAVASGLNLLHSSEHNPMLTSTYGTGQLILNAVKTGAKHIILGIGGSATTDGGIGMAAAMGFRFYNDQNEELAPIGGKLSDIRRIDSSKVDERLKNITVTVACDVTNPLFGESGAAYIYGPQKGADPEMVKILDAGLENLSKVATETFGSDLSQIPGAGAAGGLGAGALWFLNARLREGVGIVMEQSNIDQLIANADLVITGEGKVDEQTLQGKVVKGLADACREHDVPLIVVCGTLLISASDLRKAGITSAISVINRPMDLATASAEAYTLVKEATFQLVNLFQFSVSRQK